MNRFYFSKLCGKPINSSLESNRCTTPFLLSPAVILLAGQRQDLLGSARNAWGHSLLQHREIERTSFDRRSYDISIMPSDRVSCHQPVCHASRQCFMPPSNVSCLQPTFHTSSQCVMPPASASCLQPVRHASGQCVMPPAVRHAPGQCVMPPASAPCLPPVRHASSQHVMPPANVLCIRQYLMHPASTSCLLQMCCASGSTSCIQPELHVYK